ncbi:tRNA lysidine(34) synthetase TilS [uncultured Phycicoccus sp.]|uniref:tRNA lysidine(34) synthetase TilS n=1 Tax=uncultured Phycicoccus sp. TaxID=661422 RepID=UPI002635E043|nr:tRNA lysidine(34) synthetase TilS [uncultured Phycicoccus sp.]
MTEQARPWGKPPAAVAAVRSAVRSVLAECDPGDLVLVACSGGADSSALAAAARFEGTRLGLRVGAVVVDHGLQPGSDEVAAGAGTQLRARGLDPVDVVASAAVPGGGGLEAAARAARYRALDAARDRHGARLLLLGHTRDDQAEQVLLGLARGSGARSLAGMPAARGVYRRPLLDVTREQTRAACAAEGIAWWDDPMNEDPAFARVRARRALADLERDLGPGLPAALARSADLLRADADHLDALAAAATEALGPGPWPAPALADLPRAVRTRVWRRLLLAAGAPAGQLSSRHVDACDRLLTHWHGQGAVHAPGPLQVRRSDHRVSIDPVPRVE